MSNVIVNKRCDCGDGGCKERHGRLIPGCMARSGASFDGDLLPGVSPLAHPELEQQVRLEADQSKRM